MGVPTSFATYVVSAHSLVARNNIFKSSGFQMMNAWFAIGGWWSFIKNEFAFRRWLFQAFFKNPVFLPKFQNFFFSFGNFAFTRLGISIFILLRHKLILSVFSHFSKVFEPFQIQEARETLFLYECGSEALILLKERAKPND